MVSFLNTSRNSNLKIPNTKHENGDLIIYCSIPATTHRQRPTGIRVAARGNIIDKNTAESHLYQQLTGHMP